jgi:hypothetical protein
MDEAQRREAAIKRLENRRGFVPHLLVFVMMNAFFVGVWAVTGAGYFWPMWIIGPWAVGLLMHAWTAFGEQPITEAEVQEEIRRSGPAVQS